MNKAPHNSPLDAFLRDTLKNADDKFQPIDWSELEVLLKPEQRSIPEIPISKKNMLLAAAGIGVLIVLFGLFKLIQHHSSLPEEPQPTAGTIQNSFSMLDTLSADPIDSTAQANTSGKDSTALTALEKRKADSLAALVKADSAARAMLDIVPVVKIKEKKKKQDTTRKATTIDTIAPPVAPDTALKPAPKEVLPAIPAASDTSRKAPPENSGGKKKKSKSQKSPPLPTDPKTDPAVTKPDSLQQ